MSKTLTGLDQLGELKHQNWGRIGYLCHGASVDHQLAHGASRWKQVAGERLRALFAPQHGLATDAQDNMIESPHFFHHHYEVPVFSLYSETRVPTPEMLATIDTLVVDLQDNGTRVYTYLWTMVLAMEACGKAGVKVVVLDRPNPLGGTVCGNMGEAAFRSIIGWLPLPMAHGLTLGELARYACRWWGIKVELEVIPLRGWHRHLPWRETKLPWVMPSPNFPTLDTAAVYPGTVLIEGTNVSEGRGTTRPFEIIGHPALDPFVFCAYAQALLTDAGLQGFVLRPTRFEPTFDKYAGQSCGGFQLHVTEPAVFQPWHTGQWLLRALYQQLGSTFTWRQPPFEYVDDILPIDLLNGTDRLRKWVEQQGSMDELRALELAGRESFLAQRQEILLY